MLLAGLCQVMPASVFACCVHECCVGCQACLIIESLVFVHMVLRVIHPCKMLLQSLLDSVCLYDEAMLINIRPLDNTFSGLCRSCCLSFLGTNLAAAESARCPCVHLHRFLRGSSISGNAGDAGCSTRAYAVDAYHSQPIQEAPQLSRQR